MHLEKLVITLRNNRKIVLFIVEGITDEISLGLVLSKIIEKGKLIRFKVVRGDITTEYGTSSSNILNKITNLIKEFIAKDIYRKKDIHKVIHIVDTDGVYIDNGLIIQKDINFIEYSTQKIFTKNIENIIKRNEQKRQVLNKLIGTNNVYKDLPYEIYFFSSNLEHVLHNNQNVSDDRKQSYADKFADRFADDPSKFIEFINNNEFAVNGDYNDTWNFIKEGINSLNRYTNFHLYINESGTDLVSD